MEKIIKISNVGKFKDYAAAGDVSLKKITLIYAENGRGKTTLCDIFRSLSEGDHSIIQGRRTLGSTEEPYILIRTSSGNAKYENGSWNTSQSGIHVYDSKFVAENVYAGDVVDGEQKRNLLRIIVGKEGVSLAQKVDELDIHIAENTRQIKQEKASISGLLPSGMSIDDYLTIDADKEIDVKIEQKASEVRAIKRVDELQQKPSLSPLNLPVLPVNFHSVLRKNLEGLSSEAERSIRDHLEHHTNGATDRWLARGVEFSNDTDCPFCQQDITQSDLVGKYKQYFGEKYNDLKKDVAELKDKVLEIYSSQGEGGISQQQERNDELLLFWKEFISIDIPELDLEPVITTVASLGTMAKATIDKKANSLLEEVTPSDELEAASANLAIHSKEVETYNLQISQVNEEIAKKKGEMAATDLQIVESQLEMLQAIKNRFSQETVDKCDSYTATLERKTVLAQEKEDAKIALDEHTEQLLQSFQKRINQLLTQVNADFRLVNVKREYKGGKPRSSFQVLINSNAIDLGDSKTPNSSPSFRNTLSSGDRSTLALAFFLAKMEIDPELASNTIVLDDPFNSQDQSRQTWTRQKIQRLSEKAEKIVVLSHEPMFLKTIYQSMPSSNFQTLQLCRIGSENTAITQWDIVSGTSSGYVKDHETLSKFSDDGIGELRDVARTIRPLLEGYLRMKFVGIFEENEWLGDLISKIRDAESNSPLSNAKCILEELEDINDFSKKYHHEQNPGADTESINDSELKQFVRRTLDLVGGF